jgi:hypothetical protein
MGIVKYTFGILSKSIRIIVYEQLTWKLPHPVTLISGELDVMQEKTNQERCSEDCEECCFSTDLKRGRFKKEKRNFERKIGCLKRKIKNKIIGLTIFKNQVLKAS